MSGCLSPSRRCLMSSAIRCWAQTALCRPAGVVGGKFAWLAAVSVIFAKVLPPNRHGLSWSGRLVELPQCVADAGDVVVGRVN